MEPKLQPTSLRSLKREIMQTSMEENGTNHTAIQRNFSPFSAPPTLPGQKVVLYCCCATTWQIQQNIHTQWQRKLHFVFFLIPPRLCTHVGGCCWAVVWNQCDSWRSQRLFTFSPSSSFPGLVDFNNLTQIHKKSCTKNFYKWYTPLITPEKDKLEVGLIHWITLEVY